LHGERCAHNLRALRNRAEVKAQGDLAPRIGLERGARAARIAAQERGVVDGGGAGDGLALGGGLSDSVDAEAGDACEEKRGVSWAAP
jgi:hypothetical protein